jgi:hypothetical protein
LLDPRREGSDKRSEEAGDSKRPLVAADNGTFGVFLMTWQQPIGSPSQNIRNSCPHFHIGPEIRLN